MFTNALTCECCSAGQLLLRQHCQCLLHCATANPHFTNALTYKCCCAGQLLLLAQDEVLIRPQPPAFHGLQVLDQVRCLTAAAADAHTERHVRHAAIREMTACAFAMKLTKHTTSGHRSCKQLPHMLQEHCSRRKTVQVRGQEATAAANAPAQDCR
jgi:hypothetical protein